MNEMADDGQDPVDQSALDRAAEEEFSRKREGDRLAEQQAASDAALQRAEEERQARARAEQEPKEAQEAAAAAAAAAAAIGAQQAAANQQPAQTAATAQNAATAQTTSEPEQLPANAQATGATAAARTTGPAGGTRGIDLLEVEPEKGSNKTVKLVAAGVGLALLAGAGIALFNKAGDDTDVSASPSPEASASSQSSPGNSQDPGQTPSTTPTPQATAWAWTGTDPAATEVPTAQLTQWCNVAANEQVVNPSGGGLYPGSTVLVGPQKTRVPDHKPYPAGWRDCTLGYQKQPVAKNIAPNSIRDNADSLKNLCTIHSGFDFGAWKVANFDTRTRPRENFNYDGSVALVSPDGWLADCELNVHQPTASLVFIPPMEKGDTTCPRAQAVQRKDMAPGMPEPPMGPDGKPLPPPPGFPAPPPGMSPERMKNLYWITAFGRVPDVGNLRQTAHHATYALGNGTKGDSEIFIRNGVAIANHTWFLKPGDNANVKPTITFFDKSGKKLHSCTAS
ncbi:hypothetical protein ACTQ49_11410 [Luteococcus sp. Sow4_B9]|uniref:hypothetical protein n=1 Tax=Luteococcus sp. Sow4_B9 TaxID=3438792 RepID=UPI003F94D392